MRNKLNNIVVITGFSLSEASGAFRDRRAEASPRRVLFAQHFRSLVFAAWRGQVRSAIKRYAVEPGDRDRAERGEDGKARRLERRYCRRSVLNRT